MKAEMMTVTPEMASEWLRKTNKTNRPLSRDTVNQYSFDMKNGFWKSGYDPIVINEDGVLENGQHRLSAVVDTGISMTFFVVMHGKSAMETYDRGRPRTIRDSVAIRSNGQITAINQKVAVVRFILRNGLKIKKPSDKMLYDYVVENDYWLNIAVNASGRKGGRPCRKTPCVVAGYCALRCGIPTEIIEEFFDVANSGFPNELWQSAPVVLSRQVSVTLKSYSDNTGCELESITEKAIFDFSQRKERKRNYIGNFHESPYFWKHVNEEIEKLKKLRT